MLLFFAPPHFNNTKRVRKASNVLLFTIKPERKSGVMGMTPKKEAECKSISRCVDRVEQKCINDYLGQTWSVIIYITDCTCIISLKEKACT